MKIFKNDTEAKRVMFNLRADLAERLEKAKVDARQLGRKLDIDAAVDEAMEKFLKKAEKKLEELLKHPDRHGRLTKAARPDGQDKTTQETDFPSPPTSEEDHEKQ